jgi:uncharacterized membrane protein
MTLNVLEVSESASRSLRQVGCVLLALMTATLGAISIVTGDFAYTWQPVPEGFPGREIAARITGLVLVVASALFVIPRTFRRSVIAMTLIFAAWLFVLHVPRLLSGENWLGSAEFLLPLGACLALIGMIAQEPGSISMPTWLTPDRAILLGRMCFGVGLVGCGASHFVYAEFAAQMIPAWIPGRLFFTYLTGAGHIAAGLSLLTGVWMRLSTALLCLMLACFVLLLHVPRVLADPGSRHEWTMLVVASLFNGAAWLMAAAVRSTRTSQSTDRAVRDREPIAA